MKIKTLRNGALPRLGYLVECNGEAAIIDPPGPLAPEILDASRNHVAIKYLLSTSFHPAIAKNQAELKTESVKRTIFGSAFYSKNPSSYAVDGEKLALGDCVLEVLHTPGHSGESTCYLLVDAHRRPVALFSGETLLINSTGFPNCAITSSQSVWQTDSERLHESIVSKLSILPDHVLIYPGRYTLGSWSVDTGMIMTSTLGDQKKANPVLGKQLSKYSFGKLMTEELHRTNLGNDTFSIHKDGQLRIDLSLLTAEQFISTLTITGALVIDVRNYQHFLRSFVPGSIFIDINRSKWLDILVPDKKQMILVVSPKNHEHDIVEFFKQQGYLNVIGVLSETMEDWIASGLPYDSVESVSATQFTSISKQQGVEVLDVRNPEEFHTEHIAGALNIPLEFVSWKTQTLNRNHHYYIYGTKDYRALIFISFLKTQGFSHLTEINGGLVKMRQDPYLRKNRFIIREDIL